MPCIIHKDEEMAIPCCLIFGSIEGSVQIATKQDEIVIFIVVLQVAAPTVVLQTTLMESLQERMLGMPSAVVVIVRRRIVHPLEQATVRTTDQL